MTITEIRGDIFQGAANLTSDHFFFAHCISADFALGAGIAKTFRKKFNLTQEKLKGGLVSEDLSVVSNVFNLITKQKYWHKPTLSSLERSVRSMKEYCRENFISTVVMPKIGCGLDRLSWPQVRNIIEAVFSETDISLYIFYL